MESREIPKGWREETLVDLLESLIDYRGKTPEKSETGIQVLSAKSVKMGYIDYSQVYYISEETYKKFMVRGFPKKGDILMTTEAPLGCIAKLDKDKITPAQRLLTLRGKEGILDNDYLMYYLISEKGQHELHSRASGTTVQGIKRSEFINVKITLPESYEEQVAIGQVLSSLDEKIELLEEENKTLETLAQTIFTEWFVNFNFPGATGEMEESELGKIPKGWRVGKLGEFISVKHGYAFKGSDFTENSTNRIIITPGNFSIGGGFKSDKFKYLDEEIQFPSEYIFKKNDLIVTMTDLSKLGDTLGYPAFVPKSEINMFLHNQRVGKIEFLKEDFNKYYLYFVMCSRNYRGTILGSATGSTVKHTAPIRIQEHRIPISNDEVIENEFDKIVKPIMRKVFTNNEQIQTLKTTRDTLLPKLTTGEIRVDGFGE